MQPDKVVLISLKRQYILLLMLFLVKRVIKIVGKLYQVYGKAILLASGSIFHNLEKPPIRDCTMIHFKNPKIQRFLVELGSS